ncbi:MAG: DUF805 domain-containing protein [Bacteroidales bacterium]|nr:DUF805 domain-containing protein [Bacteroidales bacterium]
MKYFLKCFKQYVDFNGRARRREFWFFALFCSIISLILMIGIAVPIVKQASDQPDFYGLTEDDEVKNAIHTENLNEANAEEILNLLTEKGIVDLPAEVTENADAKIAKAQVVTVNAENLDDETVKDLFDMLQKNGIVDEELSDKVMHNGEVFDSKREVKNDDGTSTTIYETDYVKRMYNMMTRMMAKNPFYWIWLAFNLVILLPSIAVAVRRLHDLGRSGWWYLLFAVLMALPVIPNCMHLTGFWPTFLNLLALAITIFYIVVMCKDSQPGENKWGPNPKELSQPQD